MEQDFVLIDVRSPEEFASSHAEGAINFDVQRLVQGEMLDLAKDAKLKLCCQSGGRAELARSILEQ
jgi:rhodanese-related sulfurtransferase